MGTAATSSGGEVKNRINRQLGALLCAAMLAFSVAGCATAPTGGSTPGTTSWSPGAPDALTSEHYQLAVAAIDKRSKTDAQAALHMLRDDVSRMRTNAPSMMAALALLYGVSNAVDAGDWDKARMRILELQASYGRH